MIVQLVPVTDYAMILLDVIIAEQSAYYGQVNSHCIANAKQAAAISRKAGRESAWRTRV